MALAVVWRSNISKILHIYLLGWASTGGFIKNHFQLWPLTWFFRNLGLFDMNKFWRSIYVNVCLFLPIFLRVKLCSLHWRQQQAAFCYHQAAIAEASIRATSSENPNNHVASVIPSYHCPLSVSATTTFKRFVVPVNLQLPFEAFSGYSA